MKKRVSLLLVAFLLCFTVSLLVEASGKSAYRKVLKKYTRSDELYQNVGLYASISWHATLLCPDYLAAQAREASRIYHYDPVRQDAFLDAELSRVAGRTAFFLSFYAFDRKFADLSKKGSDWQLRLVVGGHEYDPEKIERIDKPTMLQKWFYPYINLWSHHYIVTFPPSAGVQTTGIAMEVRGPFGHGILKW